MGEKLKNKPLTAGNVLLPRYLDQEKVAVNNFSSMSVVWMAATLQKKLSKKQAIDF
jgi:hypothetical protein